MIKSLNNDPFDAVFFFEEEFGKVAQFQNVYFREKDLLSDVLKHTFGDIDLSEMKMRKTSIWRSQEEEQKNLSLPLFEVWFVTGVYLDEKMFHKQPHCILGFPTISAQLGSIIILEDFFKYFFRSQLYVCYDSNGVFKTFENNDHCLFNIEMQFINDFKRLFRTINDRPISYIYTAVPRMYLHLTNTPGDIGKFLHIDLIDLIVYASIRRWLLYFVNHLLGKSEFDEKVIIPFLASCLCIPFESKKGEFFEGNPIIVKTLTRLVLELIKILESEKLRNLDYTRRCLYFAQAANDIDASSYCDNIKEVEEILKDVRKILSTIQWEH